MTGGVLLLFTITVLVSTVSSSSLPILIHQNVTMLKHWPWFEQLSNGRNSRYYLRQYFPKTLKNTYESDNNIFPYYNTDLAKKLMSFQREYEVRNVSREQFCLDHESVDSTKKYHYYSGDIMQPEFELLRRDLPLQELFSNMKSMIGLTGHLWLGEPHVAATMHYDAVHNIFIQLFGRKKIRLISPKYIDRLKLYGRHHPFSCQSRYLDVHSNRFIPRNSFSLVKQSHLDVPIIDNCDVSDVQIIEVELNPMDILYIPPYWMHDATALDCSISVSLWWDTRLVDQIDDIMVSPLPIEDEWSHAHKLLAIFKYLHLVIDDIDKSLNADEETSQYLFKTKVKSLLMDRYSEDLQYYQSSNPLRCFQDVDDPLLIAKIEEYSALIASKFLGLIIVGNEQIDNSKFRSIGLTNPELQSLMGRSSIVSGLGDMFGDTQSSEIQSLLTILAIKVTDYVEDVLLFVNSVAVPSFDKAYEISAGIQLILLFQHCT